MFFITVLPTGVLTKKMPTTPTVTSVILALHAILKGYIYNKKSITNYYELIINYIYIIYKLTKYIY